MKSNENKVLNWENAIEFILTGGILVYPTDTLWGLGCRADDAGLCHRCLSLKGRDRHHTASVIVPPDLLDQIVELPPDWERFLPGPYTLVLPTKTLIFNHIASEDGFLGCRIPNHSGLMDLVSQVGVPLVTTSLNPSGRPPVTTFSEARQLAAKWSIGIIAEETRLEGASTVMKWNRQGWRILRVGAGPVPAGFL